MIATTIHTAHTDTCPVEVLRHVILYWARRAYRWAEGRLDLDDLLSVGRRAVLEAARDYRGGEPCGLFARRHLARALAPHGRREGGGTWGGRPLRSARRVRVPALADVPDRSEPRPDEAAERAEVRRPVAAAVHALPA